MRDEDYPFVVVHVVENDKGQLVGLGPSYRKAWGNLWLDRPPEKTSYSIDNYAWELKLRNRYHSYEIKFPKEQPREHPLKFC